MVKVTQECDLITMIHVFFPWPLATCYLGTTKALFCSLLFLQVFALMEGHSSKRECQRNKYTNSYKISTCSDEFNEEKESGISRQCGRGTIF